VVSSGRGARFRSGEDTWAVEGAHARMAAGTELVHADLRESGDAGISFSVQSPMNLDALLSHADWVRALAADILGDSHRAEDAVQETWLAAVQHTGGRPDEPRGRAWLARVVRNAARMTLRGESRRRRREAARAAPEAQPSVAETLERIALQEEIAAAVRGLESPDREIVALRYFEGLAPREIARRQGLSPGAVHSRLGRARAALRARLEERYGPDRSWAVIAVGWGVPKTEAWALPAALAGGLAVKTLAKLASLSALVLLAVLVARRVTPVSGSGVEPPVPGAAELVAPSEPEGAHELAASAQREAARESVAAVAEPALAEVEPPAPAAPATFGSVLVRVRRGDDGAPAPGIGLRLYVGGRRDTWFHSRSGLTDEQGLAHFDGVPAGAATVYIERLSERNTFGAEGVEVVAGKTSEVAMTAFPSAVVRGRVVDYAGRAVAGADVWLGDGSGPPHFGQVVARTAGDGTFEIHHASSHQGVAARKAGYAPSLASMPLFHGGERDGEIFLELVLPDVGGALEGEVVDERGGPIADAIVLVGNAEMGRVVQVGGKPAYDPPLLRLRSDAGGRFRADGLAAERVRVKARGLGKAIAETHVEVPRGGVASVRLALGPAASIRGTVQRADGRPVAGARVELEYDVDDLQRARVLSAQDGTFLLSDVPVGALSVVAELEPERLSVRKEIRTFARETAVWDAVLPDASELAGEVLREDGTPLRGWSVRHRVPGAEGAMAKGMRTTAADGSFRFEACLPEPHELSVHPPGQWFGEAVATVGGVLPWDGLVTIRVPGERVPPGRIRGRLVDADGRGVAGVEVVLDTREPTFVHARAVTGEDGTFELDGLPQARFAVSLDSEGFAALELEGVEAGADLGDVEVRRLP